MTFAVEPTIAHLDFAPTSLCVFESCEGDPKLTYACDWCRDITGAVCDRHGRMLECMTVVRCNRCGRTGTLVLTRLKEPR